MTDATYSPTLFSDDSKHVVKHERFYKPDGDCVIRVGNTLFRVHRFILGRDSSAFENMFSMPRCEDGSQEGYIDENPILLEGEKVDAFAELLSVFYALPFEQHQIRSDTENVCRLLTIAEMMNKYHFVTTSAWAISALCQVTLLSMKPEKATPDQPEPTWCTAPILRRIIEVALLCGHQMLCDHAVEKWIQLIVIGDANPAHAMDAADQFGLPWLKGISYYEALKRCDDALEYTFKPATPAVREEAHHGFSATQKAGLLSGFFSLVRRWEAIRETAPSFVRPEGCTYHAHGCLSTWQAVWKSTTKSDAMVHRRTVDVIGRLRVMAELLEADRDLRCALTPACRRAATDSVQELWKTEEAALASHFENLAR